MTQLHRVASTVLVLALTGTACGAEGQAQRPGVRDKVTVTGPYGERPTIRIDTPLTVPDTTSWTPVVGKGDRIGADATTILSLTLADARTGKVAVSTYDKGQRPLEVKLGDQVFPALAKSLVGKTADSRVVVASTPDDVYGDTGAPQIGIKGGDSIVMVADVLSTDPTSILDGPTGASPTPPASAPRIREQDGSPQGFDFQGLRKPTRFAAIPLREGTGPAVDTPDRIAVDYVGQVWGAKEPFNNTYGKEPEKISVGLGSFIKGWDRGLAGLKEGARVMLILPPGEAYGQESQPGIPAGSTLVFVIDILGVG